MTSVLLANFNWKSLVAPHSLLGRVAAAVKDVFLWYLVISITAWLLLIDPDQYHIIFDTFWGNDYGYLYAYPATAHLIFSLGVYIQATFTRCCLSRFSDDEFIYISSSIASAFLFSTEIYYEYLVRDDDPFLYTEYKDLFSFKFAILLLTGSVTTVMNRCHTLSLHLERGKDINRGELKSLLFMGTFLLICATWCAYWAVDGLLEHIVLFYFQYAMMFLLLIGDLFYSLMWTLVTLDKSNASRLPGYGKGSMVDYENRQSACKKVWVYFKVSSYTVLMVLSGHESMYAYFSYLIYTVKRDAKEGEQQHSMLGYDVEGDLKLDGVKKQDFHDTNKECVVCLDELTHNQGTNTEKFEEQDAVKVPCGHIFHYQCLMKWLEQKKQCPTCKKSVYLNAKLTDGTNDYFTEVSQKALKLKKGAKWERDYKKRLERYHEDSEGSADELSDWTSQDV